MRIFGGLITLVALLAAVFAGCDDGGPDGGEMEKVSASLGWLANGTFAPVFLAVEKGYFADEGLDVDVRQGGPGVGVELLQGGQMDFMVATVDDVPLGRPDGLEIKAVGVLVHRSPSAIIVTGDSPIQSPEDLEGKTIGVNPFGEARLLLDAFLDAAGVDKSQVEIATLDPEVLPASLLTGQVDAIADFITEGLTQIRLEDPGARAFPYSEFGVNLISTGILTSDRLIAEKPEVVRGFVRAVLRAYADAAQNPEEAIDVASGFYPEAFELRDVRIGELEAFVTLMETPETEANGLGYSTPEEWQRLAEVLADQAGLEEVMPVEEYFTNEFLPEEPVQLE